MKNTMFKTRFMSLFLTITLLSSCVGFIGAPKESSAKAYKINKKRTSININVGEKTILNIKTSYRSFKWKTDSKSINLRAR